MVIKSHPLFILTVSIFLVTSLCCSDSNKKQEKELDLTAYVRGELPVQHGMQLFNQHCASCHNFAENSIGPNLTGVTREVEKEWLKTFIRNPIERIENGDERAVQLFEKYKQYMPPFPTLSDEDMEDLLGFIHKFSEGEKKSRNNRPDGLLNPIPEKIPQSDLTIILEEWLAFPINSEVSPLTKITKMLALETQSMDRLFLADHRGALYEIIDSIPRIYLDLKKEKAKFIDNPGKASGLGSFAFHPAFEQNGLFYTAHTEPAKTATADFPVEDSLSVSLQWVLSEWKVDDPFTSTFSGTNRELLRVDMVSAIHGFQELSFNPYAKAGDPDYGNLYLGIGDGGSALRGYSFLCDNPGRIWGSIIRINPTGRDSENEKYGIPKDNPFVDKTNALAEIWASGFRNPHRFCWLETTPNQILVANIGQHSLEEVDLVKAGANYGWPNREGTFLFDVNANPELVYPLPEVDTSYSYPVIQYDHDEGNAICGGYVYNGELLPDFKNKFIFGDIPRGTFFYANLSDIQEGSQAPIFRIHVEFKGEISDLQTITGHKRVDLHFALDALGELYILAKCNGKVYKAVGSSRRTS